MNVIIATGYLLCAAEFLAMVHGKLRFLAIAFRQGPGWFLGCLLVPFADWIFFFLYVRNTLRPVVIKTAGLLVLLLGCYLAGHMPFSNGSL